MNGKTLELSTESSFCLHKDAGSNREALEVT